MNEPIAVATAEMVSFLTKHLRSRRNCSKSAAAKGA